MAEKTKTQKRVGRRSNYSSKVEPYFDQIRAWRHEGQTEENISKLLGVSYRSFCTYKNKFPQLLQVLKESKEKLVADLEKTLFQMALGGYVTKKTKVVKVRDLRTGKMVIDREEIQEEVAKPSASLLIFSLKNLKPESWQDRRIVDNTISDRDQLKAIAETLNAIGTKGIDTSQFDEEPDE